MAALPAVPKVVRVDHHLSQTGGSIIQVRNFFQYAGTLNLADATTWLGNIATAWRTLVSGNMPASMEHVMSELTDLTSQSSPQVQNSTGQPGTAGGQALTSGVAMVIKHHIVRRYRGGHPRIYIPGQLASSLLNETTWATAALASIVSSYQTYIAAAIANTNPAAIGAITHVNVSYFLGFTNHTFPSGRVKAIPTPRATPVVDLVVAYTGNPTVASQRRRNEQP